MPTVAISGSVKMTAGTAWKSAALGSPAITAAATSPSCEALCASKGWPAASPIA